MNKIIKDELLVKNIIRAIEISGGDRQYPPMFVWDKVDKNEIFKAWQNVRQEIITSNYKNKIGLYLHVPFCLSKCSYCTFFSFSKKDDKYYDDYLLLLKNEIALLKDFFQGISFYSVYIGGGTPSILEVEQINELFKLIKGNFDLTDCQQIIFEASPRTLTPDKLRVLKENNVDRLTIGIQTTDKEILKKTDRVQTLGMIEEVIKETKKFGIEFINLDIMAGLPGQSVESFLKTLKYVVRLKPQKISVSPFRPTQMTRFAQQGNKLSKKDIFNRQVMYDLSQKFVPKFNKRYEGAANIQFKFYEIREDYSSILGLGCGAISHAAGYLEYTNKDIKSYHDNLIKKQLPEIIGYKLSKKEEMHHYVTNNLGGGVSKKKIKEVYGFEPDKIFAAEFKDLVKKNLIKNDEQAFELIDRAKQDFNTNRIYFYSDEVIAKFLNKIKWEPSLDKINKELKEFYIKES